MKMEGRDFVFAKAQGEVDWWWVIQCFIIVVEIEI